MRLFAFIRQFLLLTRPLFLMGGFLLYTLGALFAAVDGSPLRFDRWLIGQCLVTCIQLMTHYANEYYDQEGDRLNLNRTWFSGGSGVLSAGSIGPKVALRAAQGMAFAGVAFLLVAGVMVPGVILPGVLGLAGAWLYSGPPLSLSRTGWGELAASFVVAGLVPVVGFTMQSGGWIDGALLVTLLPIFLIHFVMLIIFQIPDRKADAIVGKRTLCVRLGIRKTVILHNVVLLTAFMAILILAALRWPGSQLGWLALPLAVWQVLSLRSVLDDRAVKFTWMTGRALAIFALTVLVWVTGILRMWIK